MPCTTLATPRTQGATAAGRGASQRRPLAPPPPRGRGRLRVCALQSPDDLTPSPVAEADRALQSLLESGIRGSLACMFGYALHADLMGLFHTSAADAALGLQVAAPLVMLDALLLLPDGGRMARDGAAGPAAATRRGRALRLAGGALSLAQAERARYGLAGAAPPAQRAALAAAAQLSDELLSRGVILGFGGAWIASRLAEAGLADATLGAGGPLLSDAAGWAIAAAVIAVTGARYSHHAADKISALQSQRRAAEAGAAAAASLLRYEPADTQAARLPALAALAGGGGGREREALERGAALLLGGRFMLGSSAAFASYLATGNLLASFTAGLALQLAGGGLSAAAEGLRRGERGA
ncbi:MAG: hypothetical protein J3K34DRAFT_86206 [Monoraphidium minutum]|nr:MAG: hypothetical protein J3K34DRAFT_86206 [Monoraphidium minutum]